MNNRDMSIKELQDEYEAKISELKKQIDLHSKEIERLEHDAGVYIEIIENLHKIALEG